MPPSGPRLTPEEVEGVAAWIADGLPWPGAEGDADRDPRLDHWAWQPIRRPEVPPPVEAFREYLMLVESEGFTEAEIRRMTSENPARLFRIGGASV